MQKVPMKCQIKIPSTHFGPQLLQGKRSGILRDSASLNDILDCQSTTQAN